MPRSDRYKWLGIQCIDEMGLDGLSRSVDRTLAVVTFCPHLGTFSGRAASSSSEAGLGWADEFIQATAR